MTDRWLLQAVSQPGYRSPGPDRPAATLAAGRALQTCRRRWS